MLDHCMASARISAPRYVSGRLRSRPTTAAANAVMISSVSVPLVDMPASRARAGCRPARRASSRAPTTKLDSTAERAPPSAASSRLSTTARIAMPSRVRNNRMRRPIASATATTIVMNRCHVSSHLRRCGSR